MSMRLIAQVVDNRFMTEMRLCWDPTIDPERVAECVGPWLAPNPETVEALESLKLSGNEEYGEGTHWIERRHLSSDDRIVSQ
jgi:hypothetical protein